MSQKNSTVEDLLKSYETRVNAGDLDGILDLYSANPVLMPQNSPAMVGRDAVRKGMGQISSQISLNIKFTIHEVETMGDTAWARTSSTGKVKILATGQDAPEGNNELFILKRETGQWKIHRYLFAEFLPARDM